ncbi:flagellar basal body P-ring formation chaperone FlgA [Castellaniella caeni]|uniref:flagellar basal body P-ring formation chaperone FlgA n=1 Tax=Castellaniella caeni TaxID=266123 RepID=UPI000C9FBAEC|nr:flagellar basal body P-ring formation chaperone FlgA [Castellaniella caeni]
MPRSRRPAGQPGPCSSTDTQRRDMSRRAHASGLAAPTAAALAAAALAIAAPVSHAQATQASPAAAPVQDAASVVAEVEALIRERAAAYPGSVTVAVDPPRLVNQAPCTQLEAFLAGSGGLQSRTPVGVRCLAPHPWTLYVQTSVRIVGPYYVASHMIDRGSTITQNDLDTREGDLLRLRRVISDPARLLGWVATRRLRAGGPIEASALRDPNSIERGQAVRTIARGAGFVATGEGQALESGNPGTRIQVRTSSGQIITGTVIDANTVQVMM